MVSQVITHIVEKRTKQKPVKKQELIQNTQQQPLKNRRVDIKLSAYNKRERKLISKIFGIILESTDEKTAEMIIQKIEDKLQ